MIIDTMPPEAFVSAIDALAAERPDDAAALFERAAARDSTGIEACAEALYRSALAAGLDPYREVRTLIQLASTLRILGKLDESEALLVTEFDRREALRGPHVLHDELRATLALTWVAHSRLT